jgi:hypothetical protein
MTWGSSSSIIYWLGLLSYCEVSKIYWLFLLGEAFLPFLGEFFKVEVFLEG